MRFNYLTCCVDLTMKDVDDLNAMTDSAQEIANVTFQRRCDWRAWAERQGYAIGPAPGLLHLKDDYHVSYYRSTFRGVACYFVKHSAIEYIFTEG